MKTEFEICTGFGPVGSTENFVPDHKVLLLLRAFSYVSMGKKKILIVSFFKAIKCDEQPKMKRDT